MKQHDNTYNRIDSLVHLKLQAMDESGELDHYDRQRSHSLR